MVDRLLGLASSAVGLNGTAPGSAGRWALDVFRAYIGRVQRENQCVPTGAVCREHCRCGCYLEIQGEIEEVRRARS